MTTPSITLPTVLKRDGQKTSFDKERIYNAIRLAAEATEELGLPEVRRLTETILLFVTKQAKTRQELSVEEIQDIVEFTLMTSGYFKTAKSYIVYREKRTQARETTKVAVDVDKTISEYLNQSDWRVNENANQGYSLGGMILNTSGKITANFQRVGNY